MTNYSDIAYCYVDWLQSIIATNNDIDAKITNFAKIVANSFMDETAAHTLAHSVIKLTSTRITLYEFVSSNSTLSLPTAFLIAIYHCIVKKPTNIKMEITARQEQIIQARLARNERWQAIVKACKEDSDIAQLQQRLKNTDVTEPTTTTSCIIM